MTTDDNTETIVVARKKMTNSFVRFPKTQAKNWKVFLEYSQPLRISEIQFIQEDVFQEKSQSLRFLASAGKEYQIYFDADRVTNIQTLEAGDYSSDEDVIVLDFVQAVPYTQHTPSDADDDGVPDNKDNCTYIPNPDQADANNNIRGDACEDFDKDGVMNHHDNCPDVANRSQADTDHDGIGDVCDSAESRVTESNPWLPWMGMGIAFLFILMMFYSTVKR
ncbi:hypothetical protein COB57_04035 [Candidatus Peregrinibacteria bacterium]|nr:MAG: hypothetical protein COB57_04035 [Candidatus Peregrinibacteria bacterium]